MFQINMKIILDSVLHCHPLLRTENNTVDNLLSVAHLTRYHSKFTCISIFLFLYIIFCIYCFCISFVWKKWQLEEILSVIRIMISCRDLLKHSYAPFPPVQCASGLQAIMTLWWRGIQLVQEISFFVAFFSHSLFSTLISYLEPQIFLSIKK